MYIHVCVCLEFPSHRSGQPGCYNIRDGGETVHTGDGGPYMTYFVYRSFARESNAHLMLRSWSAEPQKIQCSTCLYCFWWVFNSLHKNSMATFPTLVWQRYLRLLKSIEDEKQMIKKPFLGILIQLHRECGPLILHAKVCRDHFLGNKLSVSSLHIKAMCILYIYTQTPHVLCDQNLWPISEYIMFVWGSARRISGRQRPWCPRRSLRQVPSRRQRPRSRPRPRLSQVQRTRIPRMARTRARARAGLRESGPKHLRRRRVTIPARVIVKHPLQKPWTPSQGVSVVRKSLTRRSHHLHGWSLNDQDGRWIDGEDSQLVHTYIYIYFFFHTYLYICVSTSHISVYSLGVLLDIPPPTFCPLIDLINISICRRVRASQLKRCAYEITDHSSGGVDTYTLGFPNQWKETGLNTCQQSKSLADGVCRAEGKNRIYIALIALPFNFAQRPIHTWNPKYIYIYTYMFFLAEFDSNCGLTTQDRGFFGSMYIQGSINGFGVCPLWSTARCLPKRPTSCLEVQQRWHLAACLAM